MEHLEKDISTLKVKELEEIIDYLNKKYNYGKEIVDDDTYDEYIDRLKELKPKSRFLREIGAPVRDELEKVKLPVHMGSMDKVKPYSKELERWIKKYKGPYFCSAKLDGLSSLYTGDRLYTRGDGNTGQDISYLIPYLDLPEIKDVYIRGELIISEKTFKKKYSSEFPKARSVVAGVINSKKPKIKMIKDIKFLAFEWYEPGEEMSASEQFKNLDEWGFKIPYNFSLDTDFDLDLLPPLLQKIRKESDYAADGIIIVDDHYHPRNVSGNPKFAVAFKVNAKGKLTTIEEVIWDPSMYGVLKPKINFTTVVIDGDKVNFATAFNAKYVVDNNLQKGVQVKIVKSGDVIPYIIEVVTSDVTGADLPDSDELGDYEWNESEIELVLINPMDSDIVKKKRFVHFFKSLSIKYIAEGVVDKFIRGGYKTPDQIFDASPEDLEELEGIKQKSAQKYYDSIHSVLDYPIAVETVMKASLALGKGFGEKKLFPLVSEIDFISGSPGNYKIRKPSMEEIIKIEGFSDKSARQFRTNLDKFNQFLIKNKYIQLDLEQKDYQGILTGKYILFTGVRNKELAKKLESLGAKIEGNLTKKTNILIVKDKTTSNNKIVKAKEKKIPIYLVDEVEEKLIK